MQSPGPSSSSSSTSLASLVQFAFLASIVYVLAGAPWLSTPLPSASDIAGTTASQTAKSSSAAFGGTLENLAHPDAGLECAGHRVKGTYVLSREPLVVYIEGFVGEEEAREVVELSTPHFHPSTTWTTTHESLNPSIRNSEKARLPRTPLIQCIEERARGFQGWRPYTYIEKLWAQRYGVGGHYTYHYDWSAATRWSGRVSSFMVYLAANCTGGGTHFPRLGRPAGGEWCAFIECEGEGEGEGEGDGDEGTVGETGEGRSRRGVVFKPIAGNAVYWENMRADGTGYLESWHAGLPVTGGVKVGLNIWSWFQDGYVPKAGDVGVE